MKKITLLLSFIACVVFAQAQTNLLVNPSFETWADGKPTGWTVPATATHATAITVTQEQTITKDGSSSFKVVTDGTQNPGYQEIIPIVAGKTYSLRIDYYIVAGDGSDARIWSNFKNGATFFSDAELTTAGILTKLKGSGTDAAGYFADVKNSWQSYTCEFTAPVNSTDFAFEFRTYKNSTVIWDNMFFGEKVNGVSNPSANAFKATVKDNVLSLSNVADGSKVEIFTALGAKVQTAELANGKMVLNNLSKGLYIVRIGKLSQKIML